MNRNEITFYKEIEPYIIRNKERNRKRGLKNTLYDYRESVKHKYQASGSMSLATLVRAGIAYQRAKEILGK